MTLIKWFATLSCVMLLNWGAASWYANHQYVTSSEILQRKIDNETELLDHSIRLAHHCKDVNRDEYGPYRSVCDLSQDSQLATELRLARFHRAEQELVTERETTRTVMLGLLGLTTFALGAVFLIMQLSAAHYHRPRRVH